jgi:hypothetical protein
MVYYDVFMEHDLQEIHRLFRDSGLSIDELCVLSRSQKRYVEAALEVTCWNYHIHRALVGKLLRALGGDYSGYAKEVKQADKTFERVQQNRQHKALNMQEYLRKRALHRSTPSEHSENFLEGERRLRKISKKTNIELELGDQASVIILTKNGW